jgi:SAM-dependent methyltransferase
MGTAEDKNTRESKLSAATRVLVVGTGNSRLPRELYDCATRGEIQVTCLDYSQPCIEMLKEMHASDCPNMNFLCGDVTDLENVIRMNEDYYRECDDSTVQHGGDMQEEWKYDCIVDKGLMDALMCNDGWDGNNGSVPRYFQQARRVMKSHGKIILITYKVNESKMEFLHMVGNDIGIQWMEILEKSNDRVSYLVGTCI